MCRFSQGHVRKNDEYCVVIHRVVTPSTSLTVTILSHKLSPYSAPSDSSYVSNPSPSILPFIPFLFCLCRLSRKRFISLPSSTSVAAKTIACLLFWSIAYRPQFLLTPSLLLLFSQNSIFGTGKSTTWHSEERMNTSQSPYECRNQNSTRKLIQFGSSYDS